MTSSTQIGMMMINENLLQAFASNRNYNDDEMDVLKAFTGLQQRHQTPNKDGVCIFHEVYTSLPIFLKKGWDSLTGKQQQQIAKYTFPIKEQC